VPNFSEGRDLELVAALADRRHVLDVHADPDHNRSVITLAAASPDVLIDELTAQVATAVERIDLASHAGVHPLVGVADVVPIVPLGETTMAEAVDVAHRLAERLWRELGLPIFFYGEAGGGRRLADIRRRSLTPDVGGPRLHPRAGAVCVGARRPLVAYNIAFDDLPVDVIRRLVRQMRELPGVQALAFPLSGGRLQLSMNLTRPLEAGPAAVYQAAQRVAGREGTAELVGLCPARAAGPGCDGGLLEARLAAKAAHWAAELARRRGGEEHIRLADRLEAEARSLRELDASQEAILGGAERAAALVRVQRPAGIAAAETDAFLRTAAVGFREAVRQVAGATVQERIDLLDHWLANS
jgi:glutamate formiminotransferase